MNFKYFFSGVTRCKDEEKQIIHRYCEHASDRNAIDIPGTEKMAKLQAI